MPGNQVDAGDNEYTTHDRHGRELIMQEHDRQERAKQWLDKESRCGRGSFHPGQSLEPGEISNYGSQERQPDYTKPCNKAQGMPARIAKKKKKKKTTTTTHKNTNNKHTNKKK